MCVPSTLLLFRISKLRYEIKFSDQSGIGLACEGGCLDERAWLTSGANRWLKKTDSSMIAVDDDEAADAVVLAPL